MDRDLETTPPPLDRTTAPTAPTSATSPGRHGARLWSALMRGAAGPWHSMLRRAGSLIPWPRRTAPTDRVVQPWRDDWQRSYPSVGLTPSRALAFLHAADGGTPQQQFELYSEMLQKWPRLAAVETTRRLALAGLSWEIATTAERDPRDTRRRGSLAPDARAAVAADYCRETLTRLPQFRDALEHLANAIGFGIAVAELVWERGRLVDVVAVPYSRLVADANEPWRLRVRTEDEPTWGVALDEQPQKWIVHAPRSRCGRRFDGGLLRASVLLYLAQNLSFKDWLIYSQIAGMPVRVARFEPGTPEADKASLLRMLESLGTDAVAVFSKNVELQFVEAARGGERPYEALQRYCNTEITILWLGQHLTTDISGSGSRAAAEVHDRVREDLLASDLADERATLERDLLERIVRARFGADTPTPGFRRSLIQSVDTKVLADTLAVAVNQIGLAVPQAWAYASLGIPEPTDSEPVLMNGGR